MSSLKDILCPHCGNQPAMLALQNLMQDLCHRSLQGTIEHVQHGELLKILELKGPHRCSDQKLQNGKALALVSPCPNHWCKNSTADGSPLLNCILRMASQCREPIFAVNREQRINELTTMEAVEQGLNNRAHGNVESIIHVVVNVWICVQ